MGYTTYQEEKAAEVLVLSEVAQSVLPHLVKETGEKWEEMPQPVDGDGIPCPERKLKRADGLICSFGTVWNKKDRLTISMAVENGDQKHRPYDGKAPVITVSRAKKPEAIAKDIARRWVKEAGDYWLEIVKRRESYDRYANESEQTAAEILAIDPSLSVVKWSEKPEYKRIHTGYGHLKGIRDFEVNGGNVRFTVDATCEEAVEILTFIKRMAEENEAERENLLA
jgi:hypothetical protein